MMLSGSRKLNGTGCEQLWNNYLIIERVSKRYSFFNRFKICIWHGIINYSYYF